MLHTLLTYSKISVALSNIKSNTGVYTESSEGHITIGFFSTDYSVCESAVLTHTHVYKYVHACESQMSTSGVFLDLSLLSLSLFFLDLVIL